MIKRIGICAITETIKDIYFGGYGLLATLAIDCDLYWFFNSGAIRTVVKDGRLCQRDLFKFYKHIKRSIQNQGFTRGEVAGAYQLYAHREQKNIIKKVGIDGHVCKTDTESGGIFPKKINKSSVFWGDVFVDDCCWFAPIKFSGATVPSSGFIFAQTEKHDPGLCYTKRTVPYANTYSGYKCPICGRFSSRRGRLGHVADAYTDAEKEGIKNIPAGFISCCDGCVDVFSGLFSRGLYWCFECGRVEALNKKYKCEYSKEMCKAFAGIMEKKEQEEKERRSKKMYNEWGVQA